jgi:uncharacterized protein YgbK (DUF1537 family)
VKVLVLADDLTGASDTVVQFARDGWSSLLSLSGGWREEPAEDAVALTLDSRRDPRAERVTARAAGDLVTDSLYVKIDSTIRGRVAEQVRGALSGYRRHHPTAYAVVCPAYPAMGRTVVDGRVLVDGVPVHESAAGRDPVTPVTDSDLTRILPRSVRVAAEQDLVGALRAAGAEHDVLVVDARDEADIERLASAIAAIGPDALPVGSAGLAGALSRAWRGPHQVAGDPELRIPLTRRALVVVSSLHEVARAQAEALARHVASDGSAVDILVTAAEREDGSADRLAREIATQAAGVLDRAEHDLLVLVGGDGAAATLHALAATGIRVIDAPVEGIPLGTVVGGRHHGLAVASKAGGFGDTSTLIHLFTAVRALGATS